jgi:hypothetical protein
MVERADGSTLLTADRAGDTDIRIVVVAGAVLRMREDCRRPHARVAQRS